MQEDLGELIPIIQPVPLLPPPVLVRAVDPAAAAAAAAAVAAADEERRAKRKKEKSEKKSKSKDKDKDRKRKTGGARCCCAGGGGSVLRLCVGLRSPSDFAVAVLSTKQNWKGKKVMPLSKSQIKSRSFGRRFDL